MTISIDEWLSYQPKKPKAKTEVGPAYIISIFNQKGGVGKTTSTISIGAALAEYGRKVLVVDFDPQGSLTVGLTGNHEISPSVYDILVAGVPTQEVILKTRVSGLDLLPAGIDLSAAEAWLFNEVGREYALQRALTPILNDYDYILIDCLPSLGLLAINALSVSQGLIIPLQCEFYALKGLALLEETIEKVQSRTNASLAVKGILPTRFGRSTHHRDVLDLVIQNRGDLVFHTIIPDTIKISDSTMAAQPITSYASSSNAAEAYRKVAAEIIERIEGKK